MQHGPPPPAPSPDPRWKRVTATLRRHGNAPHALIEAMHAVQEAFGHLEPAALRFLAATLGVPLAKVYGVATFYHLFALAPPAAHTCIVCLGTACHLKGGPAILSAVERALQVEAGQKTAGGELALHVARCIGVCSLAPAVVLDGAVRGPCTAAEVIERLAPCFDEPEESPR
jgi:bidirectional [NiFe] hydrogenase diaphorase subunit